MASHRYVSRERRGGMALLGPALSAAGFKLKRKREAPKEFRRNPMPGATQEYCNTYFKNLTPSSGQSFELFHYTYKLEGEAESADADADADADANADADAIEQAPDVTDVDNESSTGGANDATTTNAEQTEVAGGGDNSGGGGEKESAAAPESVEGVEGLD